MFSETRTRPQESCLQALPRRNSAKRMQRGRIGLLTKHCFDLVASVAALIVLTPLFLLISILVRLNDGGSIIYRRRVVGCRGEFDALKFRTMSVDADALLARDFSLRQEFEKNFKLRCDPRVTRIGAWLRKFSLDELPQLFNVLRGEMSLVGPRMISPPELEKYGEAAAILLSVKPGLTGYWQVYGRQRVDYAERVKMDVFYIQNWSLALDLKLLLLTPIRVLKGTGAY